MAFLFPVHEIGMLRAEEQSYCCKMLLNVPAWFSGQDGNLLSSCLCQFEPSLTTAFRNEGFKLLSWLAWKNMAVLKANVFLNTTVLWELIVRWIFRSVRHCTKDRIQDPGFNARKDMKETYDSENNLSTKKGKFSETYSSSNFPSYLLLLLDLVIGTAARENHLHRWGCSLHHTIPSPYPLITSPGGRNFLAEGSEHFWDKKRQLLCWAAVWGDTPGSVALWGEFLCCT